MLTVFLKSQGTFCKRALPPKVIRSIGIAVPVAYEKVISIAAPFTELAAARAMTDAIIGPTHGVHTRPRLKPSAIPLKKLVPCCLLEENKPEIFVKRRSIPAWNCGSRRLSPKRKTTVIEKLRKVSGDTPVALTIDERKSVKSVKLKMNPITIPTGRLCPPDREPERTIGRTGSMQGERTVTSPAKKANKKRIIEKAYSHNE